MLIGLGNVHEHSENIATIIENTVDLACDMIFYDMDHEIISVGFEIDDDMSADGYCSQDDDYDYTIELRSDLNIETLERTIIHELVHVWQYVRGNLQQIHEGDSGVPRMIWLGEDMTDVDYVDRPWEKQAMELEEKYYKKIGFSHL